MDALTVYTILIGSLHPPVSVSRSADSALPDRLTVLDLLENTSPDDGFCPMGLAWDIAFDDKGVFCLPAVRSSGDTTWSLRVSAERRADLGFAALRYPLCRVSVPGVGGVGLALRHAGEGCSREFRGEDFSSTSWAALRATAMMRSVTPTEAECRDAAPEAPWAFGGPGM